MTSKEVSKIKTGCKNIFKIETVMHKHTGNANYTYVLFVLNFVTHKI